ncbi:MAG: hypothetical protein LAQ30_04635 [Acidobacteriia bacterium]|nr:hypothetical protein [Terriglobia bacterium]
MGDCSKKLSREHLVSESLFLGDAVRVQGFPWCKERPKEIGLSGLTAKILCDRHNNALSSIDTAGKEFFSTMREMRRLANVRRTMKLRPWNVVEYSINGPDLERWFLKILVNLCCDRDYPIGRVSAVRGRPSEQLVRVAFGLEQFEGRAGLYFVVRAGMQVDSADRISFAPLIKHRVHIEGGLFGFRGLRLLLFLEPEGPPSPLSGLFLDGEDLGQCQLNFHNKQIRENSGKYRSQLLRFRW